MESRFPIPDAVFLLDIDPVLSVHRIAYSRGENPNHFEDRENLGKARVIFNEIKSPVIHKIDGAMSRHAIRDEVMRIFVNGPLKAKRCAKEYGCDDPFHCTFKATANCSWFNFAKRLSAASSAVTA